MYLVFFFCSSSKTMNLCSKCFAGEFLFLCMWVLLTYSEVELVNYLRLGVKVVSLVTVTCPAGMDSYVFATQTWARNFFCLSLFFDWLVFRDCGWCWNLIDYSDVLTFLSDILPNPSFPHTDIQKKQPGDECAPKTSSNSSSSPADLYCNETKGSISQSLISTADAEEEPSPTGTGVTSLPAQDGKDNLK